MSAWHVVAMIAVVGAVTFLTRAAPFWFFKRGTPRWVNYLGRVLPPAIMAILVVYCLDVYKRQGAAWCRGNFSPVAEANIGRDPEAAQVILSLIHISILGRALHSGAKNG